MIKPRSRLSSELATSAKSSFSALPFKRGKSAFEPDFDTTSQTQDSSSQHGPQYIYDPFSVDPTRAILLNTDPSSQPVLSSSPPEDFQIPIPPAPVPIPDFQSTPVLAAMEKKPGKREGLEETTQRIIQLAQSKGSILFKDIHQILNIDYRRAYDILNVLQTTPIIVKTGKKRDNQQPYHWADGKPLPYPVPVDTLAEDLATMEKQLNNSLKRGTILELALMKNQNYQDVIKDFLQDDKEIPKELLEFYQNLLEQS
ncbi:hypothetical protein RCL1_002350 [Eukaryota sp. TZLM3-RCL]